MNTLSHVVIRWSLQNWNIELIRDKKTQTIRILLAITDKTLSEHTCVNINKGRSNAIPFDWSPNLLNFQTKEIAYSLLKEPHHQLCASAASLALYHIIPEMVSEISAHAWVTESIFPKGIRSTSPTFHLLFSSSSCFKNSKISSHHLEGKNLLK